MTKAEKQHAKYKRETKQLVEYLSKRMDMTTKDTLAQLDGYCQAKKRENWWREYAETEANA